MQRTFKFGLSPSTKICFTFFSESSLKMIKNVFYFILKALFVLKIFKFLSWFFGRVEKRLDLKDEVNFKIYAVTT